MQAACILFMESLNKRLGPQAMVGDLAELGVEDMLQYDPCVDDCKI